MQEQPPLKHCFPRQARWFCWYWASGVCCWTMQWNSFYISLSRHGCRLQHVWCVEAVILVMTWESEVLQTWASAISYTIIASADCSLLCEHIKQDVSGCFSGVKETYSYMWVYESFGFKQDLKLQWCWFIMMMFLFKQDATIHHLGLNSFRKKIPV